MATTLTQLIAKLTHKLGETTDDGMLDNPTESINVGLQQMATEYDWPWLIATSTITTAADDNEYDLPSDCTRVRAIWNTDYKLKSVQFDEIIRNADVPTQLPYAYYPRFSSVLLAPTPGAVYTLGIEYIKRENVLTTGSDVVVCPDFYVDIVVVYAAIEEAKRRRDVVLVNLLEASRDKWIQRIRDNINRSRDLPDIFTRPDTF